MEITNNLLVSLGFIEIPYRPTRYSYKGVTGRLEPDGFFYFHGFSLPISNPADLKYMVMLIDYQQQATVVGYPIHYN